LSDEPLLNECPGYGSIAKDSKADECTVLVVISEILLDLNDLYFLKKGVRGLAWVFTIPTISIEFSEVSLKWN
jgi:hypothetical protein